MHTSLRLRSIPFARGAGGILWKPSCPWSITQHQRQFTAASAPQSPSYETLRRKPIDGTKNALVTGSARGIGKSIALRLALDGYNVCINDIGANAQACDEVVKEIQALGRKACTATADVSKRGEVRDMIQKSVEELGPLHTMLVFVSVERKRKKGKNKDWQAGRLC